MDEGQDAVSLTGSRLQAWLLKLAKTGRVRLPVC